MDKPTKQTTVGRYTIDLFEWTEDGEQRSSCHINYKNFCASLECADNTGILESDDGREWPITSEDLDKIRAWADANGY